MGSASFVASYAPGSVLADKYRIERVLGEGGMGVVLLAHHLHLDERVALKLPLPQALGSPEAITRFVREARAAVKIKSEYVARVIDVGLAEPGRPYIAMEFLEGEDLASRLAQYGPLPIEQAIEFLLQMCEALAEAHALGIVHRDLKPANLFCIRRADGLLAIKVLDFGISKVATTITGDAGVTKTAAVMGSPLYMSPEQMESARKVDARGDIWALGVILFELLTGRTPFVADSLLGLALQISQSEPASLRASRPEVPVQLERTVLCCLEKDRERRFGNVAELARALADFAPRSALGSVERAARIVAASGGAANRASAAPAPTLESQHRAHAGTLSPLGQTTTHSGKRLRVVLAAAVAAVVAGGIFVSFRRLHLAKDASVTSAVAAAASSVEPPSVVPPSIPAPSVPALAPPSPDAGSAPAAAELVASTLSHARALPPGHAARTPMTRSSAAAAVAATPSPSAAAAQPVATPSAASSKKSSVQDLIKDRQ